MAQWPNVFLIQTVISCTNRIACFGARQSKQNSSFYRILTLFTEIFENCSPTILLGLLLCLRHPHISVFEFEHNTEFSERGKHWSENLLSIRVMCSSMKEICEMRNLPCRYTPRKNLCIVANTTSHCSMFLNFIYLLDRNRSRLLHSFKLLFFFQIS